MKLINLMARFTHLIDNSHATIESQKVKSNPSENAVFNIHGFFLVNNNHELPVYCIQGDLGEELLWDISSIGEIINPDVEISRSHRYIYRQLTTDFSRKIKVRTVNMPMIVMSTYYILSILTDQAKIVKVRKNNQPIINFIVFEIKRIASEWRKRPIIEPQSFEPSAPQKAHLPFIPMANAQACGQDIQAIKQAEQYAETVAIKRLENTITSESLIAFIVNPDSDAELTKVIENKDAREYLMRKLRMLKPSALIAKPINQPAPYEKGKDNLYGLMETYKHLLARKCSVKSLAEMVELLDKKNWIKRAQTMNKEKKGDWITTSEAVKKGFVYPSKPHFIAGDVERQREGVDITEQGLNLLTQFFKQASLPQQQSLVL